MSDKTITTESSQDSEKPVEGDATIKFPPFPEPTDDDFDDDVSIEERNHYKTMYPDLNAIKQLKLHCTACDRHLGCAPRNESRMRSHPMLRALVCNTCHTFYNSGEFEKGDDGSELYCRWCGQGGQVYCCSDCPHVFCAKCIKRNFGTPKIKEIENTDDWKCFQCKPRCLWDVRALCWALLRYCDLKNKIAFATQDPDLKEQYQKACAIDDSECCKHKINKKKKDNEKDAKKKESDSSKKAASLPNIKLPATIQVKKFASIKIEDTKEKKTPQKRPVSPKIKPVVVRNPVPITMPPRVISSTSLTPPMKKIRMNSPIQINNQIHMTNPIRFNTPPQSVRFQSKNMTTYSRIRPRHAMAPMAVPKGFNGFNNLGMMTNNMMINDNINLSLDSLTQGLDMSSMSTGPDDDVVCTPDFPLEPLCEVTEENNDDDVQCITPAPAPAPAPAPVVPANPPPLVPYMPPSINDLSSDNIIQMTENDVTVNAATGGLKFRVDPQTLSSNKMYRLPDGRIFAINVNPNMPGGYSATIVAVTETNSAKSASKGSIYAAKLNTISSSAQSSTKKNSRVPIKRLPTSKPQSVDDVTPSKKTRPELISRTVDLDVSVEWFRYNLIDAADSLHYSLTKLQKMKKGCSNIFLRTRTVNEIKNLHKSLDRILGTSVTRFNEIRNNLNKEIKQYISKKNNASNDSEEDDDDVEILNDTNDDPIFIDENSVESFTANEGNSNTTTEVDLTGSNDRNDGGQKSNVELSHNNETSVDAIVNETSINESAVDSSCDDAETNENFDKVKANSSDTQIATQEKLNGDSTNLTDTEEKTGILHGLLDQPKNDSDLADSETNETENNTKNVSEVSDTECKNNIEKLNDSELADYDGENNLKNKAKMDETVDEENVEETQNKDIIMSVELDRKVSLENADTKNESEDIKLDKNKFEDSEMTQELIETLLEDDEGDDAKQTDNTIDVSDEFKVS